MTLTRSDLVLALRSLHESDLITNLRLDKRRNALFIDYLTTNQQKGQLILPCNRPQNTNPTSHAES